MNTNNSPEEEDFLDGHKLFRKWILKIARNIILVVVGLHVFNYLVNPPQPIHQVETYTWKGYDPNKPDTEIKTWDFDNHTLIYTEYSKAEDKEKIRVQFQESSNNGDPALLEELDLDIEDVLDYYRD